MQGASVSIRGLAKSYGGTPVLSSIDLEIDAGEFLTLLGPSGCGKSTLLRIIAGFEPQADGTIVIGGRNVDALRPKQRGLSMVFQSYALYPHMSVFENIATPLVMRQMSFWQRFPGLGRIVPGSRRKRVAIAAKVRETARLLEISDLLARRPGQLSGGQRQRVALGRAIIPEPSVFLMDEPLSNLDARLRIQMRNELTELHRKLGITFIYVTHDQAEAMTMSRRVAVMMDGALIQVGTPFEVYSRPADLRVARFIGTHPINLISGIVDTAGAPLILGQRLPFALGSARAGEAITIGIRPEDLGLDWTESRHLGQPFFDAQIVKVEDHGADLLVNCALVGDASTAVTVRVEQASRDAVFTRTDGNCRVLLHTDRVHFFDQAGVRIDAVSAARPTAVIGARA